MTSTYFHPLSLHDALPIFDVRTGGANYCVMKSPEGEDMPMRGVYREVVKNEKIVFTDAYNRAWEPSDKPFFTGIVTFEDAKDEKGDGKTRYTARALQDRKSTRLNSSH